MCPGREEAQMTIGSLFKTTTSVDSPLDASSGDVQKPLVSDFLTVQSLTNFAAMTGSITAAWNGLRTLNPQLFSGIWVPYAFAFLFGFVSILISLDGLKKNSGKLDFGSIAGAIFIGVINSIVLASAVVGASVATGSPLKT
jgi:hypothetical protein